MITVGLCGLLMLLLAYYMILSEKCDSNNLVYLILNLVGCIFLMIYDVMNELSLFFILQFVWGFSAFIKLIAVGVKDHSWR